MVSIVILALALLFGACIVTAHEPQKIEKSQQNIWLALENSSFTDGAKGHVAVAFPGQKNEHFFVAIYNGFEYLATEELRTWEEHEDVAIEWGGHLASILSQEEQDFLLDLRTLDKGYFIGGERITGHASGGGRKTWRWTDGSPWEYTKWNTNEPNNIDGAENHVMLKRLDGSWNDVGSERVLAAIFKRSIKPLSPTSLPTLAGYVPVTDSPSVDDSVPVTYVPTASVPTVAGPTTPKTYDPTAVVPTVPVPTVPGPTRPKTYAPIASVPTVPDPTTLKTYYPTATVPTVPVPTVPGPTRPKTYAPIASVPTVPDPTTLKTYYPTATVPTVPVPTVPGPTTHKTNDPTATVPTVPSPTVPGTNMPSFTVFPVPVPTVPAPTMPTTHVPLVTEMPSSKASSHSRSIPVEIRTMPWRVFWIFFSLTLIIFIFCIANIDIFPHCGVVRIVHCIFSQYVLTLFALSIVIKKKLLCLYLHFYSNRSWRISRTLHNPYLGYGGVPFTHVMTKELLNLESAILAAKECR